VPGPDGALDYSNLDLKSWFDRRVLPLVERIDGYQVLQEGHAVQAQGTQGHAPTALPPRSSFIAKLPDLAGADAAKQSAAADSSYVEKQILPASQKIGGACANAILGDSLLVADAAGAARLQYKIAYDDQLAHGSLTQAGVLIGG
jgi:hypothetical protein